MKTPNPLILSAFIGLILIVGAFTLPQLFSQKNTSPNVTPQLTTGEAGFNDIVIQARGTNGKEKIALFINNAPVQFWNLTNNFQDYTYTPNGEITVSELSIHFLNDTWEPEKSINYDVQIPYITVNGTKYNSEHSSTVSTGSWDQDNWCAPGNKQTQWLHCTGSFTYNVPVGTVVGLPNEQGTFEILSHSVPESDITSSSVKLTFTTSESSQTYVQYGTTTSYGQERNRETSFDYATHNQTIRDLSPETQYFYKITVTNQSGDEATATGSFTTFASVGGGTGPVDPVIGWDNDLPHGGRAIGVVTSGITTGNSSITKYKSARRFLATRSGPVKGFGYQNRMLTDQNVKERAEAGREKYVEMVAAVGIDGMRGSYMLGNAYSVGNGGLQEVSLQTDKNGEPSGEIIAIAKPYIPKDRVENGWRIEDFINTANVEAGQLYWLVWENLNPPSHSLTNLSASEARNAEIDAGAIGLNGPKKGDMIDPDEPLGPFLRDFSKLLIKSGSGSAWRDSDVVPFMSIVYADGVETGETYSHLQGQSDFRYEVEGNKALRQQFTWRYNSINVDRVVTRFGHTDDANGKPMNVTIKDASGSILATSKVLHDSSLKTAANSNDYWRERQTRHAVGNLSKTVEIEKDQKYYIEYIADSGAGYLLAPAGIGAAGGTSDRHIWEDANAQQSVDGGSSWKSLNKFTDWDIPVYLIPVGVATQTPTP